MQFNKVITTMLKLKLTISHNVAWSKLRFLIKSKLCIFQILRFAFYFGTCCWCWCWQISEYAVKGITNELQKLQSMIQFKLYDLGSKFAYIDDMQVVIEFYCITGVQPSMVAVCMKQTVLKLISLNRRRYPFIQ